MPDLRYLNVSKNVCGSGNLVGKLHNESLRQDIETLNSERSPINAIRSYCLACRDGRNRELRKCVLYQCPVWIFRLGENPSHGNSR